MSKLTQNTSAYYRTFELCYSNNVFVDFRINRVEHFDAVHLERTDFPNRKRKVRITLSTILYCKVDENEDTH